MPANSFSSIIKIGEDVLGTSIGAVKNMISAQLGDSVNGDVESDNAEWWQHVGFASRPSKANPGESGCQVLAIEESDYDICFASRDTRVASIYGSLGPGETCIYAGGPDGKGTGRILLKNDGSTETLSALVLKSSNQEPIILQLTSEGKVVLAAGSNGAINIDSDGIKLVSGKDIQLGATGSTTIIGQQLGLNAASVSLGANATDPVVLATQLIILLSTYQAFFATLTTALNDGTILTVPAAPSYGPLIASLGAITALTPNIAQIPSTTVTAAK